MVREEDGVKKKWAYFFLTKGQAKKFERKCDELRTHMKHLNEINYYQVGLEKMNEDMINLLP